MALEKRILLPLGLVGLLMIGGILAAGLTGAVARKGITTVGPRITGTP